MLFYYISKHIKRGIVTNMLFCSLLALSGALLCISAGLWYSANKAIRDIDKTITTIAVPDQFAISKYVANTDEAISEEELRLSIHELIYGSGLFEMDKRRLFGGFALGFSPVSMRTFGVGTETGVALITAQSMAVFVATCVIIKDDFSIEWQPPEIEGERPYPVFTRFVLGRFSIDEVINSSKGVRKPRFVDVHFWALKPDGTLPVKTGGQYVLVGNYSGGGFQGSWIDLSFEGEMVKKPSNPILSVQEIADTESMWLMNFAAMLGGQSGVYTHPDGREEWCVWLSNWEWEISDAGEIVKDGDYILESEIFPFESSQYYQVAGSGEGYSIYPVDEADYERINEKMIATNAIQVLTTNNPNSLLRLNQRRDFLTAGRSFTQAEIKNGSPVCLVSSHFAETNMLKVGDTIPLSMFAMTLGYTTIPIQVSEYVVRDKSFWVPSQYDPSLPLTKPIDYEIVGIYEVQRAEAGDFALSPNMVIIPDNSISDVPGTAVSRFDIPIYPMPLIGDSLIAPNGKTLETREQINSIAAGYGNLFKFYDQGYRVLMDTYYNMRFGMSWILALALFGWTAVAVMFLLFYVKRKRNEAELLQAIGIGKRERFKWVFVQCVAIIFFAQVITLIVTLPIYGSILETATKAVMIFTTGFRDMILSDAVEAGVRRELPLDRSPVALIITTLIGMGILLTATALITKRTVTFIALNDKGGED